MAESTRKSADWSWDRLIWSLVVCAFWKLAILLLVTEDSESAGDARAEAVICDQAMMSVERDGRGWGAGVCKQGVELARDLGLKWSRYSWLDRVCRER